MNKISSTVLQFCAITFNQLLQPFASCYFFQLVPTTGINSQSVIMNSTQLLVPILDGKNYNRWCVQMRVLFDYHEFWDVVESGVFALGDNAIEVQRVAHRDQKKKDNKALYLVHQGMNDETFE